MPKPLNLVSEQFMTLFDNEHPIDLTGDLFTPNGLTRLQCLPSVGPKTAIRLAERFSFWERLAEATAEDLITTLARAQQKKIPEILGWIPRVGVPAPLPAGVKAFGHFDPEWPQWLRSISDPPAVVFVRGSLPPGGSLGVVGTRHPTRFGFKFVELLVAEASSRGTGVVSGLALGIDGAAHRAALANGVLTWAILGSGVDCPSPREHLELAEEIISVGGGLLSEQLPGTPPIGRSLVARNRLQSAASFALVVAQCGIPSGTLHTARFALQQGRRLVVPRPRPPWDQERESAGNLALSDPNGCSPAVLQASGALVKEILRRKPVADLVIHDQADIARIWE